MKLTINKAISILKDCRSSVVMDNEFGTAYDMAIDSLKKTKPIKLYTIHKTKRVDVILKDTIIDTNYVNEISYRCSCGHDFGNKNPKLLNYNGCPFCLGKWK